MRPKPCWQRQGHIWKNGELQTPVAIDCCQEVREDRFIPCLGGALILRRMKTLPALLSLIFLAACTSDVVGSNYATLAEARADQLFGRGWLPDVLPASAFNIRTSNNLDLNQSEGEFSFRPDDSGDLFQKWHRGPPGTVPYPEYSANISAQARLGYSVWSLQMEQATWVFFCRTSEARCLYTMWLDQQGPNNSRNTGQVHSRNQPDPAA